LKASKDAVKKWSALRVARDRHVVQVRHLGGVRAAWIEAIPGLQIGVGGQALEAGGC